MTNLGGVQRLLGCCLLDYKTLAIKKETVVASGAEEECFKVLENLSVVCVEADLRVCGGGQSAPAADGG